MVGPMQVCPKGTICSDNPARPDCLLAADCPGICMKGEEPPLYCGGSDDFECADGRVCVDDPSDECNPFTGGVNCTKLCTALPSYCGGTTGVECPTGYACTNDPDSWCKLTDGFDCTGICALTCGGDRIEGANCPEGMTCVNDPAQPGCLIEVDCLGICQKGEEPSACGGMLGNTCSDGFRCADDPNDGCQLNDALDCGGSCAPVCGGIAKLECPVELFCNDDPFDDCDPFNGGTNCIGVCQTEKDPALFCGGKAGSECPSGFTCVDNPNDECDPDNGGELCGGTCQRICGGFGAAPCPDGSVCFDDTRDDCDPDMGGADCSGICEKTPRFCSVESGTGCPSGYTCTFDPDRACILVVGFECPGICALSCGGFRPEPVDCPDGTECVDDPADSCDVALIPDCPGVCLPKQPVYCGGLVGDSCPDGLRCADDPNDGCQLNDALDCGGYCVPECGGLTGKQCPDGFFCNEDPFDDCDPVNGGADCVGICQEEKDPALFCGGNAGSECPAAFTCVYDLDGNCDPTNGDEFCGGTCQRVCGGFKALPCANDQTCVFDTCAVPNDCTGICKPTTSGLACSGNTGIECPAGFVCVDEPDSGGTCQQACGGYTGLQCLEDQKCVDYPYDNCVLGGSDPDCVGICQ